LIKVRLSLKEVLSSDLGAKGRKNQYC
jgi:hypothetical protein